MHTINTAVVKRKAIQSQYIYFVCRKINPSLCSLTDFIGKVGRGTRDRWKNYGTAYSSDYTTYIWMTEMANEQEKKILAHLKGRNLLRKHLKGKYSEVLNIPCSSTSTISSCITTYESVCIDTISHICNVVGEEPTQIHGTDIRTSPPMQAITPIATIASHQDAGEDVVSSPPSTFERPSLWQRIVSFIRRRL